MKKVIIVSYYLNIRDTDRCNTVYTYFKERGYDVKMLCGNFDHNSKKIVSYGTEDIEEIPVKPYKKNMSVTRMLSAYKFGLDVKKKLRHMNADIVYVVGPPNSTAYILRKTIRKIGAKFVSDIYDLYPETIPISDKVKKVAKICGFWWWSYLRDSAIKKADVFIGSCQYYFTVLNLKNDNRLKMVPLCKSSKSIKRTEILPNEKLNILYLGALTGNYDFEGLIKIMMQFKQKGKPSKLYIIGDGPRKEWLLSELDEKDIEYEFLGRIYDDDIKSEVMGKCHFGFNGFKENVAIALSYKSMEYMSNALALINCCKEDTWELVKNKNIGINYTGKNIAEAVDSLIKVSAEDIFEMQNNASQQYDENYSYECYKKKMDEIFN